MDCILSWSLLSGERTSFIITALEDNCSKCKVTMLSVPCGKTQFYHQIPPSKPTVCTMGSNSHKIDNT